MITFKLWLKFLGYVFRSGKSTSIFSVSAPELLGREIFSRRNFNKSKRVFPPAFQPKAGSRDVSVTRLSLCSFQWAVLIARRHSRKRHQNLYGFANVPAKVVLEIGLEVRVSPLLENPFHADMRFPADTKKDALVDFSRRIAERATFEPAS
jgi:hypothetical protein